MIEINTKYTYEGYKQYYWFSLFRGKYYRYGKIIFHFFTVLAVVIAILSFTWINSVPAAVISIVGTVAFFWLFLMSFIRPKRYVRQSPALFQSGYTFIFDEDRFSIMQTGDITSGTSTSQSRHSRRITRPAAIETAARQVYIVQVGILTRITNI